MPSIDMAGKEKSVKEIDIFLLFYGIAMNLAGFLSMGIDKDRARKQKWRIRERTLFLLAILGGSAGSILGMRIFHHKTKHPAFTIGMPVILAVQLLIIFLFQGKFPAVLLL